MKITANKFVAVTYDLNVGEGEERELMERATAETPLKFIFGTGAMLPAFEDALKGLEVGDKFNFSITPADAYGEYVEEHVLDLPKNIFEVDGKFDSEMIKEGNTVPMMDSNGNRMNGSVLEVKEDVVVMDSTIPCWLAKHCISMVKLSMYTNRQLKKSQPSQLRLVDAVVDVTTAEAVVATITTKVDADVADAIKELTIDNFSKGEYIWKHIQADLFRRVARSRNRRRNRRMPCWYRTRYGIYPK